MSKLKNAFKSLGTAAVLAATTINTEAGQTNQNSDAFTFKGISTPSAAQTQKGAPVFTNIGQPKYNNLPKPMVTSKDFLTAKPDKIERTAEFETRTFLHKNGSKTTFYTDSQTVGIFHYNDKGQLTHEVSYDRENPQESSLNVYKDGNLAASFIGGMPKTDIFATPTPLKAASYIDQAGNHVGIHFDAKGNRSEIRVIRTDGNTTIYNFGKDGKACTETLLDQYGKVISVKGDKSAFKTNIPGFEKGHQPRTGHSR